MSGDAETTAMSTTEGPAASWTQRAEERTGGGGSRTIARLVAPFVAVVPWVVMAVGHLLLTNAYRSFQIRFEMQWGLLLLGTFVLLVAALLWGGLGAWSSSGPIVAGVVTIAAGLAVATSAGTRLIYELGQSGPSPLQQSVYGFWTPTTLVPIGALLLAAGLGAAAARRLGRRRG